MPLYIYAIAQASVPGIDLPEGIAGKPVYRVATGPLAAFVSDYPAASIRPERRHIAASQTVLRALQAEIDLLPAAFGTLTATTTALVELLDKHSQALLDQLARVAGNVEMGLRLELDGTEPIAYLLAHSAALRQARDRAFGRSRPPSHEERLRLGQLCEQELRRFQETQSAQLVALLAPACSAIAPLPTQGDRQVANLAALVPRSGLAAFEAAVHAAAESFADDLAFRLNGPWPPHNFVQLNLGAQ